MTIDKNSYGTLAIVYIIGAVILLLVGLFTESLFYIILITLLVASVCIWQTAFFRVPVRRRTGDGNIVTSVADGEVVIIDKVFEPECLKCECIKVSVYMDFFDVHANFWPMDGKISYYRYYPGKHFLAFQHKASDDNEHTCIGMVNENGTQIFFKQLAGFFARRIVCYAKQGSKARSGSQCGIIKFGSRIDMYLPLDAEIKVKIGDKTRAVETVIAVLQ